MSQESIIVGSEEWCALPNLGIHAIKARVDSGAKTSSIHAFNIQHFRRHEQEWVSFEIHPLQNNRHVVLRCESPVVDKRDVKSSSGITEKRYVIKQKLELGGSSREVELTLANRDSMGYRMLLGREAMIDRILINPSARFCLGEIPSAKLNEYYAPHEEVATGLKIGVLASDPNLYSNQRILEAGSERGHEMIFLNIKHCYMRLDSKQPQVHYRGGKALNDLDGIIPRIRPSATFYGCALVRQFEAMGIYSLNSASAIAQSRDKLYASQLMIKNNLAMPVTGFANSPSDTADLIEMVGGAPLIVKLLEGAQGRGIVLAETKKAAESVINAFKSLNANLLVQEFIKEAAGVDLRCFVINGKVAATMSREAAAGDFRANLHQGGTAKFIKLTAEERKLAVKATKMLDLKVGGVDILRSRRGPLLLEVNSSPGLEGIEEVTGKDIAGMMIAAVEKGVDWKRELGIEVAPAIQED